MSYDVRDNWGRKVGSITSTDGGCGCAIFLALVCVVGVVLLISAISNYTGYGVWTLDTNAARATATAKAKAPYQFSGSAISAKRDGPTSVFNHPQYGQVVNLEIGGSLTFENIHEPEDGVYMLIVWGNVDTLGAKYTIDVIVNGSQQTKLDEGHLNRFTDESLQPTVQLNKGNNTVELVVENGDTCYPNGVCPHLNIEKLDIDKR